jgi:alpha-L-fucosidase
MSPNIDWFVHARYGMFIHFGVYSLLERGEWVLNREQIPLAEYRQWAAQFNPTRFDAEAICDLAVRAGMRYLILTTMHCDGYRLYPSQLTDFCCRRDLVGEIVTAARRRDLRVGLYHSLTTWTDRPDAVDALEDKQAYERFIHATFERIRELVTRYNPIDVLWYDGWWPFDAAGWRSEQMNAMVRAIQPHILFNGRNGLSGDFATPEQHITAPNPWRPWEANFTLNNNWGYHRGDHDSKTPWQVLEMLATVARKRGNLLLNIGPRGDGSIPEESVHILETVGDWLRRHSECIFDTDAFTYDMYERGEHRGDWNHFGPMTVRGNNLYLLARRWPGETLAIAGWQCQVRGVKLLSPRQPLSFRQQDGCVRVGGLPAAPPDPLCPVLCFECDRPPALYLTAGMRIPRVPHPHYDPCPSNCLV